MVISQNSQAPHPPRPRVTFAGLAGWVLFDVSTQPFYTLLTTFIFAPFFASHIAADPVAGQAIWGYAAGGTALFIAIMAPILGAIADASGHRKPWIAFFAVLLVVGAASLWFAVPGQPNAVLIALAAFAIATIGSEFATLFNNAMMPSLVDEERLGRLSGIGWGLGYVGGLVCLVIALGFLVASPETGKTLAGFSPLFGLDPASYEGDRASGPLTAIWFAIFVLPLFIFTPDTQKLLGLRDSVRIGLRRLFQTIRHVRGHANVLRFLIAHMIYTDGLVAIFAFGGIYAAGTFGWKTTELGIFGIIATITGTIGGLAGGWFDDRLGSKRVILGCIVLLIIAALGILSIDANHILFVVEVAPSKAGDPLFGSIGQKLYLALGAFIGMIAAPLQSSSRTLIVRISPRDRMTQFFGLYALAGKLTSFSGPIAVGLVTSIAASQRVGISVLAVFFLVGGLLVIGVRPSRDA